MKIETDIYLTADELEGATQKTPKLAVIKGIEKKKAEDLPFESKTDRYEIVVEIEGEQYKWLANKTSVRKLAKKYTTESENWIGKKVNLWIAQQNVGGAMKNVIYGEPAEE
jgi:hypothetical protein